MDFEGKEAFKAYMNEELANGRKRNQFYRRDEIDLLRQGFIEGWAACRDEYKNPSKERK